MNAQGYQMYQTQAINTMTKGELLLLLYDEMLKRLTRAEVSLEKGDMDVFYQSVHRTKEIVEYLIDTLNYKYPISKELSKMYEFFLYYLARLDASKNAVMIKDLKELTQDLRDAFAEASKRSGI